MVDLSGIDHKSIVERAKAMILKPKEEWPKIVLENQTQGDILRGYVLPLAAIGPVAGLIGGQLFGLGALGFSYRPPLIASLISAVVGYGFSILAVFILMLIADFLAPKFDGQANKLNAFKMVAYSWTAAWLAGIFGLIPTLGFFAILGLYSFYLFYMGATPLMKVPQDKAVGYTAVTIVCAIVLSIVAAAITAPVAVLFGGGAAMIAGNTDTSGSGTLTVPGVGSIDVNKAQRAANQMENAANGKVQPIEAAKLQELLPAEIGAFKRTATQTMAMGAMGSTAEGTYTAGDKSFTLSIADMSALGALGGLVSAMGVEQSREDADSYEKTGTVDGQMQTESWNKSTGSGTFGHGIANRFMVKAEGNAANIDQLKAAVAAVDQGDLTDLVQ